MINSAGDKEKLKIRRLVCDKCKRIHHELPDCIVPYKRHCAETIEKIINGKNNDAPCNSSIIRRVLSWWNIVLPYFLHIIKSLSEKYNVKFGEPPAFVEIVRAAVNSNNWVFANSICTRSFGICGFSPAVIKLFRKEKNQTIFK